MNTLTIGSAPDNLIRLRESDVAPYHAQLTNTTDGWLLIDLDTNNQTRVNGWPIRRKVIIESDWIALGSHRLSLRQLLNTSLSEPDEIEPESVSQSVPELPNNELVSIAPMSRNEAADLLSVPPDAPVDAMMTNYRKKKAYLQAELELARTPQAQQEFQQALSELDRAKETMLNGYDLVVENLPSPAPIISRMSGSQPYQLTPDPLPPALPAAVWYARPPLLWAALAVLLLAIGGLVYDRYKHANYLLTQDQFTRYKFLDRNFTPRKIRVKNVNSEPITILGVMAMSYDSLGKEGWAWQPPVEQQLSPAMVVQPGTAADIPFMKDRTNQTKEPKAVFVSFMVTDVNEDTYQFAKALGPDASDINANGEIEIRFNRKE